MLREYLIVFFTLLIAIGLFVTIRKTRRLEYLVNTDDLTQLPNRRVWNQILKAIDNRRNVPLISRHFDFKNRRRILSLRNTQNYLVMLDIDFFKGINDTHGHAVGDKVLQTLAHTFQEHTRKGEVIARVGGEEFAALIWSDNDGCEGFLNKLRLIVSKIVFTGKDGENFSVTISMGYVVVDSCTCTSDLMKLADQALYEVKRSGRNSVKQARAA